MKNISFLLLILFLNIDCITFKFDFIIETDEKSVPEIGKGSLYAIEKYDLTITMLCLVVVAGIVFGVGWKSHQQIKQRMMEHEPDSVL